MPDAVLDIRRPKKPTLVITSLTTITRIDTTDTKVTLRRITR